MRGIACEVTTTTLGEEQQRWSVGSAVQNHSAVETTTLDVRKSIKNTDIKWKEMS